MSGSHGPDESLYIQQTDPIDPDNAANVRNQFATRDDLFLLQRALFDHITQALNNLGLRTDKQGRPIMQAPLPTQTPKITDQTTEQIESSIPSDHDSFQQLPTSVQHRLQGHVNDLPLFKVTSARPPPFDGNFGNKPAHTVQGLIEEYIDKAETQARLHGFLDDHSEPMFRNHMTYVDWVSTSLSGIALAKWRTMSTTTRYTMSWFDYCHAAEYTCRFNEIVDSLNKQNVKYDTLVLCTYYRTGLKQRLQEHKDIYECDDLAILQQRATTFISILPRRAGTIASLATTRLITLPQPPSSTTPNPLPPNANASLLKNAPNTRPTTGALPVAPTITPTTIALLLASVAATTSTLETPLVARRPHKLRPHL
ncbi:hypothetical protein HDU97_009758, partial [Phlyctochytrium planicorne]